jgi:hypothetical protein
MSQIYVNFENTYLNVQEYEVKIFHNSEFILSINFIVFCTIINSYHTIAIIYVCNQMNSVHLLTLGTVLILCIILLVFKL